MFKYTLSSDGEEYNGEFDESYLKRRQWKAAVTAPGLLYYRWAKFPGHRRQHPEELIEFAIEYGIVYSNGRPNLDDALTYWLEFNCLGRWDKIGHYKIEFEEECDALMYKLIWSEYL